MTYLLRVFGVLAMVIPLHMLACMDATRIEVKEVRVDGGEEVVDEELEAEVEEQTYHERLQMLLELGDEMEGREEEYALSEQDLAAESGELVIDEDAPTLEVLSVEQREGNDSHYFTVSCHDPVVYDAHGYSSRRWVGGHRRYVSRECEVELATVVRAMSFAPAVDFRVAPTPTGFRVLGDFNQGDYEMRLLPGLRSSEGAILKEEKTWEFEVPTLSPSVDILTSGRYLPRAAWEELSFRHRNVDEVEVEIRHIPKQNLAFWITNHSEHVDRRTSDVVVQTRVAVRNEEDQMHTSALAIEDHLGSPEPGLYQISVTGEGVQATARLQVTDINLVVKQHEIAPDNPWPEHIDVWSVDMESNRQISGVRIESIRPSGSVMSRCTTNWAGHCRLTMPEDTTDEEPPVAVLARKGEDLTYLAFRDVRTELSEGRIDGRSYLEEATYLTTLYGDRNLYRPGDTFYVVGALRDVDYSAADEGIPTELTIRDPQGKIVVERQVETDEAGMVELSFAINEVAPTGHWRAELEVGTRLLETYSFHVEEFVPERLEASARATSPRFVAGEEANFEVSARYLFGASAEGSEVEVQCRMIPMQPGTVGNRDYSFGALQLDNDQPIIELATRHGVIGEDDRASVACAQPEQPVSGPVRLEVVFAISEAGSGRTTRTSAFTEVHPSPFRVGLRSSVEEVSGGDTFFVEGVITDLDGNRLENLDEEITLEFFNLREQRSRQYNRGTGRYSYDRNVQFLLERVVDVTPRNGRFRVDTTAADVTSSYLVRARMGDARTDLKIARRGRYWNWSAGRNQTPRPLRPTTVRIDVPDEAPIGSPTRVDFHAPFAGRTLLTVETNEVLHQTWVDAKEGKNNWSFMLEEHVSNVYVTAFIIRDPRHESANSFTPERAFGAASVNVERTSVETPVEIRVPEEVRPGERMQVELAVGEPSGVTRATIAVVDEGILQLINYKTPDPLDVILARRALGVQTFDTVGWATQLPPTGPSSRTGGGDYEDEEPQTAGRILPFRPVAMWSGPVEVDANGRAVVDFEIPNYRGRLRVMAAVFTEDKMGSAEADVLVRDPLTIQTTFPRFLTVGDVARIPVFLANLTDVDRQVDIEISAREYDLPGFDMGLEESDVPILEFVDGATRQVNVAAGESTTVYFRAKSIRAGGAASMLVTASSGDLLSRDEGMIPFRAGGPRERRTEVIALDGSTLDLTEHLAGWVPTSEQSTLWLSAMSSPEAFDHLEYLVRYPYGCAEQTVSSARPLLFVSQFVEVVDPQSVARAGSIERMVDSGINRILSMQAPHGGFSYWPGGGSYHTWITAYALHFLLDALELGYDIPQSRVEQAVNWLKNNIEERSHSNYVDRQSGAAYAHYVLALAGEAQMGSIRRSIEGFSGSPEGQNSENQYLLQAALYLGGDRSFEAELRDVAYTSEGGGRNSGWGFYSHQRQRAMKLNIFVDLFSQHEDGRVLAEAVTADLSGRRHRGYTTQEILWGVTGLGKWLESGGEDNSDISLVLNGKELEPKRHVNGLPAWSMARASEMSEVSLRIENHEEGAPLYAILTSEGVREEPTIRYGGEGLSVKRIYRDREGNELAESEMALGEMVYVELQLQNTSGRQQQQVALVDRLPAGLEVEHPDLGSAPLPQWASTTWSSDHFTTRDDRVEIFGSVPARSTVNIFYAARATLSGEFHIPPVEAEAMYDPEVWAREEGGELRISAPWQELVD